MYLLFIVYVCICMVACALRVVRALLAGVGSLLLPRESLQLKSGYQVGWQAPLSPVPRSCPRKHL